MTSDDRHDAPLDAYLDGRLGAAARLDVEAEDGEALALQRSIDDELRRAFAAPEGLGERVAASVRLAAASTTNARVTAPEGRRWTPLLQAAAALLVALGLGTLWSDGDSLKGPPVPAASGLDAEGVFANVIEASQNMAGACVADGGFDAALSDIHGQPVSLRTGQPLLGPFPCDAWPTATALTSIGLGAEPAVILIDVLERDPGLVATAGSDVGVNRREVGPLVVYELTRGSVACGIEFEIVVGDAVIGPPAQRDN